MRVDLILGNANCDDQDWNLYFGVSLLNHVLVWNDGSLAMETTM